MTNDGIDVWALVSDRFHILPWWLSADSRQITLNRIEHVHAGAGIHHM